VVGEFPELQGLMGKYYALAQGEDASVAAASEEHYKPQGPADRVPTDPVSIAVALADKIDTLTAFLSVDEFPTGSRDPYGLRRAEMGIVRILEDNGLHLDVRALIENQYVDLAFKRANWDENFVNRIVEQFSSESQRSDENFSFRLEHGLFAKMIGDWASIFANESMLNLGERLIVLLRARGARHDLVHAVVFVEIPKDIVSVIRRVEALGKFLDTDDGKNLLAGTKRASNIVSIEEKKDKRSFDGAPDARLYSLTEEKTLAKAIDLAKAEAGVAVAKEDFAGAMSALAKLRPAVDAFFDKVKVNDDEPNVRENRLKLLNEIRAATRAVADFSKIQD
jgi:glycyl-tRNA synthetase beta chain